ncbi:MAG TPA: tetratricopeptide repeat protein [Kofleriaceae bacterium]|nr:tetratricopeptide repeat protein [Kofleriaceae bacterium]
MKRTALACLLALAAAVAGCSHAGPRPAGPPPGDPLGDVRASELYRRGLALARMGDFVRAEQYLTSAIARGFPEERALPALLRVCVASSRLRAALGHAEPYLERNPDAWSLRYLVSSIYLGVGEVDRARESLERVIADAPDQPDPYYLLGVVLRDEVGDRPGAARRFSRYLALAPAGAHAREVRAAVRALEATPVARPPRSRAGRRAHRKRAGAVVSRVEVIR